MHLIPIAEASESPRTVTGFVPSKSSKHFTSIDSLSIHWKRTSTDKSLGIEETNTFERYFITDTISFLFLSGHYKMEGIILISVFF